MTDKFGGNLISQRKNTEATGGGAENSIPVDNHGLEKTTHIHFTVEGDASDCVDWFDWIKAALDGENAKIIHGNVNTYYTPKKKKDGNDGSSNKPK